MPGGGVDVDRVDPGAQLVDQPAARGPFDVGSRQWPQYVPDDVDLW
jgi:hypothetical protein